MKHKRVTTIPGPGGQAQGKPPTSSLSQAAKRLVRLGGLPEPKPFDP